MSKEPQHHDTGYGRQAFIVMLLTGGVILLHRFAVPTGVDPTPMLALGFMILASYTIGNLVGVIQVPHITGYLAAGLFFGPSAAQYIGQILPFPPFEEGILNREVLESLRVFDTLAVALIALTAGGELKIEGLRRGLKVILGVLTGQLATMFVFVGGLVWLISGPIPAIAVAELADVGTLGAIGLGLVVASISVATSPAATIAVINSTGAEGPVARTVLSTVVLKDVLVVIAFSVSSALAAGFLGMSSDDQHLSTFLMVHIVGSLIVGVALGFLLALYLRFVGREVLLMIVGVVFAASLMATNLDLDPVLLFMAAGFTVSNFSREGDTLIQNVERLSMPVYVVFFTMAGAGLHLEAIAEVGLVAGALVLARLLALYLGVGAGARVAGADAGTSRFVWLGFASQAGVAITLAKTMGQDFGETGAYLETVLITGVALNELMGPILLKVGLGLAGEIPSPTGADADAADNGLGPPSHHPPPILEDWPEPDGEDPWGSPPGTASPALDRAIADVRGDLQELVDDVTRGLLEEYREEAKVYLRDLRREFLRHHRRLTVRLRDDAQPSIALSMHAEESELAERWHGVILGRGARLGQRDWTPTRIVDAIDAIADSAPERLSAPYEPETFRRQDGQSLSQAVGRAALSMRRRLSSKTLVRSVELRGLARYHLAGVASTKLESFAALLVSADVHLAARTRSVFESIIAGYDAIADGGEGDNLEEELRTLRVAIDRELALALDETTRMAQEGAVRLSSALGGPFQDFAREAKIFGTPDLPTSARRTSKVFRERIKALDTLEGRLEAVQGTLEATYSLLALELDLLGLEARVKDALDEHVRSLTQDVRGRTHLQADRLETAIEEARNHLEAELGAGEVTGDEVAATIRQLTEPLEKVAAEAEAKAVQLREQLSEENTVAPLLDALRRAAQSLGDRYKVPRGRLARGEHRLPPPVAVIEVPFRDLVIAHVEAQVAPGLIGTTRAMSDEVQPLVVSFGEIARLIAFNVELASTELDVVADEVLPEETRKLLGEIFFGALDRGQEVIHCHAEASRGWADRLGIDLREAVLGGIDELRTQLVDGDLTQDRVDLLRRRAAGLRLMEHAEALPSVFVRARALAKRTLVNLIGGPRIEAWRRFLGLPGARRAWKPDPTVFARREPVAEVPLVYRRLFAAKTVEAADVLTGRDAAIDRARRVLSGKTPGQLRSVALIGPDGVGKGALARAILRARNFRNVRQINLDGPTTVEEVNRWFEEKVSGQLFVLSGFHWLVSMDAGGFAPLSRFVHGVICDGGRNSWLLYGDRLVWQVACQAAPIAEAFPEVVDVAELAPAELEAAVLARHGLSGYGLNFEPRADRTRLEEIFARSASRIRRPYEAYFRALHDASGGLVRDALMLWLTSIDEVDEAADFVRVGAVPKSPEAAVRALPEEVLLNLYQVARQGWMNATVQSHVYRVDVPAAEARLARLAHMGLLEARDNGAYRIPAHLRGPVYRVLKTRGWVQ
ncbi:MAG: cation:proton antiporter [Deltaproteobacteria bacterium]|nr:cation:proton antiporter [Deltaproteobacteria bacterium]